MTCKGICNRFQAFKSKGKTNLGRYAMNQKRCQMCSIFISYDRLICPCCHYKLRLKRHGMPIKRQQDLILVQPKRYRLTNKWLMLPRYGKLYPAFLSSLDQFSLTNKKCVQNSCLYEHKKRDHLFIHLYLATLHLFVEFISAVYAAAA
jgi:hypothetical protein